MRSHILFLEVLPTISGGQRVLLDLMPALAERFDVTVVVPGDGPLAQALQARGSAVSVVPMADFTLVNKSVRDLASFAADTPRLTIALRDIIRRKAVHLVYANSSRAFVWGTLGARLAGRPIIWHAHNILGDRKTLALIRILARTATVRKIVCASEAAAAQFPMEQSKTTIVPQGVDLDVFAPLPASRERARAGLGIGPKTPVAGLVGDLIPLKGQDVFIRAAQTTVRSLPSAVFLVVGDERPDDASRRYRQSLQSAINQLGPSFRLLGFQPDIVGLLNALDVLVIASTTETGPLVLMQALACGVPVISTPVGWAPQLLGDGVCGDLYPSGDDAALAEKLVLALSRPAARASMSQTARLRAVERVDLKESQARIVALIQATLNQP
jgi:glycosyltransferase involved in cell wall biosynthesis